MRALAVFRDLPDWKAAWLKRGFRHVLAVVETDENMVVVVDPAGGGAHLWAGYCKISDVADYYRGEGMTVVEAEAAPGGFLYPTRWTCVELVKRVLGIRGFFILTPHQLYRRLTQED